MRLARKYDEPATAAGRGSFQVGAAVRLIAPGHALDGQTGRVVLLRPNRMPVVEFSGHNYRVARRFLVPVTPTTN